MEKRVLRNCARDRHRASRVPIIRGNSGRELAGKVWKKTVERRRHPFQNDHRFLSSGILPAASGTQFVNG
jgi:hypothetical protein